MTRVLLECTYVFEHPGDNSGIQRVVRNVIAEAPRLRPGADVRAVIIRHGRLFEVTALRPSRLERRAPILERFRVRPLAHRPGDQLVLLDSSWHSEIFPTVERLKADGVAIIGVIYDLFPISHPHYCDEGLVRAFDSWFRWLAGVADGYLAISRSVQLSIAPQIRRVSGQAVAENTWFDHFYLGSRLDLTSTTPEPAPSVKAIFAGGRSVYLMVGTIEPRKNQAFALEAFEQLWRRGSQVSLCIAGKAGWKLEAFIERIRSHPEFGSRLHLFHDLDDASLGYAYSHARALIFPSRAEGFGLPMVEAMRHGLPVMASDIPVFREIGGDFVAYFDLQSPASLEALVFALEESGRFPAPRPLAEWRWPDWDSTAREIVEKVLANAKPAQITASAAAAPIVEAAPLSPFDAALKRADNFRDSRDWAKAAGAYSDVLKMNPALAGIWVQLGHALKESGKLDQALDAYDQAKSLDPGDADIELQLGHARKLMNDLPGAARHYLSAAQLDPSMNHAGHELGWLAEGPSLGDVNTGALSGSEREPGWLYLDLVDALDHFARSSRPTGIQRVQLEIVSAILADPAAFSGVRLCSFSRSLHNWIELPQALVQDLFAAARDNGEAADSRRRAAAGKLAFLQKHARPIDFPPDGVLFNLGSSWACETYFDGLDRVRERRRLQYGTLIYDLIPIKAPSLCNRATVGDFVLWIAETLRRADFLICISENTRSDLIDMARFMNCSIDEGAIKVMRLDARFAPACEPAGGSRALTGLGVDKAFVLMVSTLEPRKNHLAAFRAWRTLVQQRGADKVPLLVCAGKWGWNADSIRDALTSVEEHVVIVPDASDLELRALYEGALFTLYPSHYEGWGLPVTESLCHGKAAVVADNSSLREAGGEYVEYFNLDHPDELMAQLIRLLDDMDYRRDREANILANFTPRSWRDLAADIHAAAKSGGARAAAKIAGGR